MKTIFKGNKFSIVWEIFHNTTRLPFDFTGMNIEVSLTSNSYSSVLSNFNVKENVISTEIEANSLPSGVYDILCRFSTLNEQAYCFYKNAFHISNNPFFCDKSEKIEISTYATYVTPDALLTQFNSIYLTYLGNPKNTRNNIPEGMRRKGLIITYTNESNETITERATSDAQKDNDHWGLDTNWSRIDELSLSGDLSVSANGTWIINGKDTQIKAVGPKGDTGITPWLKTIDNRLYYSYDGKNWEACSEEIAAFFRFKSTREESNGATIGNIQISRDNKNWQDLSPEFVNHLRISAYVSTKDKLPTNKPAGTMYGVGPTYKEEDTARANPIYRIYVYDGTTWVDNGSFTSIAAGIVQETGDSENVVMSQKAVTEKINEVKNRVMPFPPTLHELKYISKNKGIINYSNLWNTSTDSEHCIINVVAGDVLAIKSTKATSTQIAFLSDYNIKNGALADIVGTGSITTVSSEGGKEYIVPSGATYLYVELSRDGVQASFDFFMYNGVSLLESHAGKIEENELKIKELKNELKGDVNKNSCISDGVSNSTRILSRMKKLMGAITYDSKWSKNTDGTDYHVVIPIKGGDKLYIASENAVTNMAFVTEYITPVYGQSLIMSSSEGFKERITTTLAGKEYVAPDDANYLVLMIYSEGADFSFNEFLINGISLLKDNISELSTELNLLSGIAKPIFKDYSLNGAKWIQGYWVQEYERPAISTKRVAIEDYIPVMSGYTYSLKNAEKYKIEIIRYNKNKEAVSYPIYFEEIYDFEVSEEGYIRISVEPIDGTDITPEMASADNIVLHNGLYDLVVDNKVKINAISTALGKEDIVVDMNVDYYLDNRYIIAATGKVVTYDSSTYRIKKVDVKKGDLVQVRAYAGGNVAIISIDLGSDSYQAVVTSEAYKTVDYSYKVKRDCTLAVSFTKATTNLLYITRLNNVNSGSDGSSTTNAPTISYKELLNIAYSSIGLAPINTAEHYIMAAHCGFNAAKADVEITSDNVLICCHDTGFTFDNNGRIGTYDSSNATLIRNMTWDTISQYEYAAKSNMLGYYSKVCTIDKYLRICKEYSLIPFITIRSHNVDETLAALFPMIFKYFLEDVAIINIFPPTFGKCDKVREYSKRIKICYTQNYGYDLSEALIQNVAAYYPSYIAIEGNRIDNETNTAMIPVAQTNNIGIISYDTTEYYYKNFIAKGLQGFSIIKPILPYKPRRITFIAFIDDGGDTLEIRNRESKLISGDMSVDKSSMIMTISNIRKTYTDFGFPDGVMPVLMNYLPYQISVLSRGRNDRGVDIWWENNSVKIQLTSLASDSLEVCIDV